MGGGLRRGGELGNRRGVRRPARGRQDAHDAGELHRLLEEEVVPRFYARGEDGVPADWVQMMKASIERLGPAFDARRMVREHVEAMFLPLHRAGTHG